MKRMILWLLMATTSGAYAETFNGYECTDDCSGHEAGYNWAEDNSIDDADYCSTPSNSFNEGCESYVEENESAGSTDSDDYGDEDEEDEY